MTAVPKHNHVTRDIKQKPGQCPACDYFRKMIKKMDEADAEWERNHPS